MLPYSDLKSGRESLLQATEGPRTAFQQNTLHLEGENMQLRKAMTSKQEENQMVGSSMCVCIACQVAHSFLIVLVYTM